MDVYSEQHTLLNKPEIMRYIKPNNNNSPTQALQGQGHLKDNIDVFYDAANLVCHRSSKRKG